MSVDPGQKAAVQPCCGKCPKAGDGSCGNLLKTLAALKSQSREVRREF